jgi:hypothetical protein
MPSLGYLPRGGALAVSAVAIASWRLWRLPWGHSLLMLCAMPQGSHHSLCTGHVNRNRCFRLQRCAVLEDLLQALLLASQLLRQVTVQVALAVLPVLLSIRSWVMALCLEALACTLLPSDAS